MTRKHSRRTVYVTALVFPTFSYSKWIHRIRIWRRFPTTLWTELIKFSREEQTNRYFSQSVAQLMHNYQSYAIFSYTIFVFFFILLFIIIILCPNFHTALFGCCVRFSVWVLCIFFLFFLLRPPCVGYVNRRMPAASPPALGVCFCVLHGRMLMKRLFDAPNATRCLYMCICSGFCLAWPVAGIWVARGGGRAHKRI